MVGAENRPRTAPVQAMAMEVAWLKIYIASRGPGDENMQASADPGSANLQRDRGLAGETFADMFP